MDCDGPLYFESLLLFSFVFLCYVAQFDTGRQGKKPLNYFHDEHEGTYRSGYSGGEGPPCDPGSELLLGGRARVVRGHEMGWRNKKKSLVRWLSSSFGPRARYYCGSDLSYYYDMRERECSARQTNRIGGKKLKRPTKSPFYTTRICNALCILARRVLILVECMAKSPCYICKMICIAHPYIHLCRPVVLDCDHISAARLSRRHRHEHWLCSMRMGSV